jgi:hypothetical protein
MNEKIDSFCKELRAKLDGVDKRINSSGRRRIG